MIFEASSGQRRKQFTRDCMKIDQQMKMGIISGLAASCLFLWFLEPILRFAGRLVFGAGSFVSQAFIDRLFSQAALLTPPDPALNLEMFLLAFINTSLVYMTFFVFRKHTPSDENIKKTAPSVFSKFARSGIIIAALLATSLFLTAAILYSTVFQTRLISSFKQHMTAIGPYLDSQKEKQLLSQWTQMQSEADYLKLYEELSKIAQENRVKLPNNQVFDILSL